ncbi:MAG: DUF1080 domain-containing protein [Candidatus Synoicihabitans palmerolidicus]|nr:DUF1080 domain-containing protein [Candidatus Synoicihabitans palmerolidicus]
MQVLPGHGVVAMPSSAREVSDLATRIEHGDLELELEFLLAKGSDSGIFLQGRYEVQIAGSWLPAGLGSKKVGGVSRPGGGSESGAPLVC